MNEHLTFEHLTFERVHVAAPESGCIAFALCNTNGEQKVYTFSLSRTVAAEMYAELALELGKHGDGT